MHKSVAQYVPPTLANYLSKTKKGPPKHDCSEYCFKCYRLDIVTFAQY